jgi:NADH-quinone oxidoreductase subunit N
MIDQYSWITVYPEIILLALACLILLVDLGVKTAGRSTTYWMTLATLALVAGIQAEYALSGLNQYGFSKLIVSDQMGNWLKCFASLAVLVTLVYGRQYAGERDMLRGGELFTLSLFGLLGIFLMIGGNNLLVIYMGLELLTLSSYALVALRRDSLVATEAAMKYFVLGAMASGFLLYGMSMLYGATGTLDVNEIAQVIAVVQLGHFGKTLIYIC